MTMTHRLTWADLPASVRARVATLLGEEVARTRSCRGGFSPSTAEVVTGQGGRSLFVKAVRERDNPGSVELNRREARVLARIPAAAPVPALVDEFEDGEWFVLVTEAAPGALPAEPWRRDQLAQVLVALDRLQATVTPCPVPGLPTVPEHLGPDMLGFERVAADVPAGLDPWLAAHLEALCAAGRRGIDALAGDTLCHSDLRSDNLVIDDSDDSDDSDGGAVRLVDWAHASVGSPVADALQLLSSVDDPSGALGVDAHVDAVLAAHDLPPTTGTDVLAGILGFFVDAARLPATLPGLREHREARRDGLLPLVRTRWERELTSGRRS